ncbi:MAG: RsmE family RNA methyltransferase [Bacteroidota bacterium]
MQIFYTDNQQAQELFLSGQEAKHAVQVLRHKEGDTLSCIDGKGSAYKAIITKASKLEVILEIVETYENWGEKPAFIQVAISPLRLKDRFEWFIEKSVELGVNEIIPIICDHTIKFFKYKQQRLEQIILSATKQCKRSYIPTLAAAAPIEEYLASQQEKNSVKLMAHCQANTPINTLANQIQEAKRIQLMIGPEGDFSENEIEMARSLAYEEISLGENRLRTETAGVYFLAACKYIQGY